MTRTAEQESLIRVQNTNYKKLLEELNGIVDTLDMSDELVTALQVSDLMSPASIEECTVAARKLQEKMKLSVNPGWLFARSTHSHFC